MSHLEKIEIFNEYAKSQGYADWEAIIFEYEIHLASTDELNLHIFAACDLVQEEQQKRIADNACIEPKGMMARVDKSSITNPENKIN
ncbi:hypothetical protein [Chryseobacterium sediminis]|uniref:Uncharacterized protein n=1 Tax=Chryseobacterium sediminis TaxID=1679494 RepID=A0A5B2U8R0_9FLAO|nr:hypothetical protein [Chryseobacterium sediminis]KAA2223014.1 hypothetical protein FW780_02080 [Chryseobacterium sediminis]